MKQKFQNISMQSSSLILLSFFFTTCQKTNELSTPQNSTTIANEISADEIANDEFTYYYSATDKKLYVAEAYVSGCQADLDVHVISKEKWSIGFPAKADAEVVIMKGQSFYYRQVPRAADIRQRPRYKCTGNQEARDECIVYGTRSAHVVTVPYTYCVRTGNPADICAEEYKLVGTGTAWNTTNCSGRQVGSAGVYKWVCL